MNQKAARTAMEPSAMSVLLNLKKKWIHAHSNAKKQNHTK